MKWYSENNVNAYVRGVLHTAELLERGVDGNRVVMWENARAAARELGAQLSKLPDSSAFCSDFGQVATLNRDLILYALEYLDRSRA